MAHPEGRPLRPHRPRARHLLAVPLEPVRYQCPELPTLEEVAPYYRLAEKAGWYSNGGPCARLLTERLEERLGGSARALLVGNCTLGLMVALRGACGEPAPGRRLVVTPSFTFAATAGAIEWAGFEPLFVDIDEHSWQLDPTALERAIRTHEGRIAGVLACSTFGSSPPTAVKQAWRESCARHGVPLVVDSAAGFGAVDEHGRPLGSVGDTEVFSFHATKPFAIGEGGLIVTSDGDAFERMSRLVNFGFDPGTRLSFEPGFNAKLSEIQAAFGLAMLDRYDGVLARRRAVVGRLRARLAGCGLTYQLGAEGSTWQVFQVLAPTTASRAAALRAAKALAVEARTTFDPPLHRHPGFARAAVAGPLDVTERIAARSLSLPLANELEEWQVERIVELVERATGAEVIAC